MFAFVSPIPTVTVCVSGVWQGCGDTLVQFLEDHIWVVISVVASVMGVEVLALMIALSLCITVMRSEIEYKA